VKRARAWFVFAGLVASACNGQFRFEDADAAPPGSAPCKADSDCPLETLHCDPVSQACVACTTDAHCTALGQKRCDVALHRCIACGSDADCARGEVCERTTRQCLKACNEGTTEDICPPTAPTCDEMRGICIGCQKDLDCSGTDDGNLCDTSSGRCVFCITNDQCPTMWPRCDRTRGRCRQCLTSADCDQGRVCDPAKFFCM
jgi:Cys-rich repeat protein